MELKDLFLTPLYLGVFYAIAFAVRKQFTNAFTRKYFIPALSVKFLGAISLGLVYQFYYGGGDTFNYFRHIQILHSSLSESFSIWLRLLQAPVVPDGDMLRYTGQMYWYTASTEYFVVRLGSVFSLICFNTYSIISLCFAAFSFAGMWSMYITFLRIYPLAYKKFAIAVFFLPSVFFWGSGLMKDSLCLGALGWTFYGFYHVFIARKFVVTGALVGTLGIYVLVSVKIYILLSFAPPALLWVFNENNQRIKSAALRIALKPFFLLLGIGAGYIGATGITAGDERYDVEKIGERTKINQEYLTHFAVSGSAYDIGEFDGSTASLLKTAPQAVVVSIFRPFLFEVRNPVMLLSALEATLFIWLTVSLLYKTGLLKGLGIIASTPLILFSFLFATVFAIGVGINSGNFGTLVRYKIPLMPFYLAGLYMLQEKATQSRRKPRRRARSQLNNPRKVGRLATTE
ncbi:hypothetical protein ACFPAF_14665 [Hymenobacter endophyticus]|uniref:Glycosyltransferase RgtA/B/C/D-like domain-containing protein n=1 Tax=Hymenobacter endophyticus TaxID=3076335 RepID=A0ABU3TJU1_9BACT|nr:hypothetical protein [Hymenobacter endophyticus]MDU0371644.1 hypothetical protein [Hymenobacter endophyticus]